MHIERVSIFNFKNHHSSLIDFDKGMNVIVGQNGSGKSNIIRAIKLVVECLKSDIKKGSEFHNELNIILHISFSKMEANLFSMCLKKMFLRKFLHFSSDDQNHSGIASIFLANVFEIISLKPYYKSFLDFLHDNFYSEFLNKGVLQNTLSNISPTSLASMVLEASFSPLLAQIKKLRKVLMEYGYDELKEFGNSCIKLENFVNDPENFCSELLSDFDATKILTKMNLDLKNNGRQLEVSCKFFFDKQPFEVSENALNPGGKKNLANQEVVLSYLKTEPSLYFYSYFTDEIIKKEFSVGFGFLSDTHHPVLKQLNDNLVQNLKMLDMKFMYDEGITSDLFTFATSILSSKLHIISEHRGILSESAEN